ncbi:hypothetical protein KEM55_008457, partial [Ascosphaera atra]
MTTVTTRSTAPDVSTTTTRSPSSTAHPLAQQRSFTDLSRAHDISNFEEVDLREDDDD